MSDKREFSAGQLLGEDIRRLGREELVALALEVCEDAAACGAPYHGNIHPGNISRGGSGAALGPRADHAPGDWSTDELEYMAPELFWNGTATAAADVYSVGLLLYAGVTGGLLPFFKRAPENMTNELRASALRRRMNGDPISLPAAASGKLGPVIEKCLRFDAGERYRDTRELAEALRPCVGEGDAKAMEMFGKPERELTEVERMMAGILSRLEPEPEPEPEPPAPEPPAPEPPAPEPPEPPKRPKVEIPVVKPTPPPRPTGPRPEYRVDRDFEERAIREREERPKRNMRPFYIVLAICAVVVIAALAVSLFLPGGEEQEPTPTPTSESLAPSAAPSASPSAEPSAEPTPSPTPSETPEPAEPSYELTLSNSSWEQAQALCKAEGGHLAVISSAEELAEITALAEEAGAKFVWIGLHREAGELKWVTGESVDYYVWGSGEPSVTDSDGTPEDYVLLWHTDSGWIYNDCRNDPAAAYPSVYGGKLAYACEYDSE